MGHILVQQRTNTKRVEGRTVVKKKKTIGTKNSPNFPQMDGKR